MNLTKHLDVRFGDVQFLEPQNIAIEKDFVFCQIQLPKQLDQVDFLRHTVTQEGAGDPLRAILVDDSDGANDIDETGAFLHTNLALVACSTNYDDAYLWRRKLADTDQNLRALQFLPHDGENLFSELRRG